MDDLESRGYEPVHTQYNHAAETALRATHACVGALSILLQVLLDEQRPPDEALRRRRMHEADDLLRKAGEWARRALEKP